MPRRSPFEYRTQMSSFITGAIRNVSASPLIDKHSLWPSLRTWTDSHSAHEPNLVAARIYQTRRSYLQVTQSLSNPSIHPSLLPRLSPSPCPPPPSHPLSSFLSLVPRKRIKRGRNSVLHTDRISTSQLSKPPQHPPTSTPRPQNHCRRCLSRDKRWRRKMSVRLTYETLQECDGWVAFSFGKLLRRFADMA